MTGWETAVVQPGNDGLHGEMVRNDIVGPPCWVQEVREKEEMAMIPSFSEGGLELE